MDANDMSLTSVVIAGKPGIFRTGVELVLKSEPEIEIGGTAETGDDAVRMVRMRHPNVVILDLHDCSEPDEYGHVIDGMHSASEGTAVVAMLAKPDPIVARDVLRTGVAGCITRDIQPGVLVEAVRQSADGETYIASQVAMALAQVATQNGDGDLSAREYEVLRLLAMGYTNREVAEKLYLSVRTIESHRARLQMKLGVERRSDLVRVAHEYGLAA